jgi:hypothetical protein
MKMIHSFYSVTSPNKLPNLWTSKTKVYFEENTVDLPPLSMPTSHEMKTPKDEVGGADGCGAINHSDPILYIVRLPERIVHATK